LPDPFASQHMNLRLLSFAFYIRRFDFEAFEFLMRLFHLYVFSPFLLVVFFLALGDTALLAVV